MSYWETQDDKPANLRGGGTDYLVYDKNDGFGGAFFVKRFSGWFSYAAKEENKLLWLVKEPLIKSWIIFQRLKSPAFSL